MKLGTEKCTIQVNIIGGSWQNLDKDSDTRLSHNAVWNGLLYPTGLWAHSDDACSQETPSEVCGLWRCNICDFLLKTGWG